MNQCPDCGAVLHTATQRCPECGAVLSRTGTAQPAKPYAPPQPSRPTEKNAAPYRPPQPHRPVQTRSGGLSPLTVGLGIAVVCLVAAVAVLLPKALGGSAAAEASSSLAALPSLPDSSGETEPLSQPGSEAPLPGAPMEAPAGSEPESTPAEDAADLADPPADAAEAQPAEAGAAAEYILPNSDSAYLTDADLAGLNKEQLRLARNEILARHGRMFRDQGLQDYFNSKSWYVGTIPADTWDATMGGVYNDYEAYNIELIKQYEAR